MDNLKILITGKNKFHTSAIKNVIISLTKNINICNDIGNCFYDMLNEEYDFLIADYDMFDKEFSISSIVTNYPNTDVIIVSSAPTYKEESSSLSQGAKYYIDLNGDINTLKNIIMNQHNEKMDRAKLRENLFSTYLMESNNEKFNRMLSQCEKVAKTKTNILLTGESGTGKEVAAKYIHLCSARNSNNFVAVNCSSYTETLLESELFGYEQGSFTGAAKSKQGKFELADGGVLFLDEVGDIILTTQVKLLRVLETKRVERIGSNKEKLIDFRLISATNKNLTHEVLSNSFREDFFYRISSIVINVPPLRERKEDIELLINYFLKQSQEENNIEIKYIDDEAKKFLYSYDYPGNIRELKSIVDRMVVLSNDGIITKEGIPILYNINKKSNNADSLYNMGNYNKVITFKDFKHKSESDYLKWVLGQTGGNVAEAARQLNISSRQLFNKIREYNLVK